MRAISEPEKNADNPSRTINRIAEKIIYIGVVTIIPVVVTGYFLYWFATTAKSTLGSVIRLIRPQKHIYRGWELSQDL